MGSIYKITNTVNGKAYIGQTIHDAVTGRIRKHLNESSRGNQLVKRAVKKYGKDVFIYEILHDGIIPELLDSYEIEAIEKHNTLAPNGYNLTHGGEGGIPSEETRKKLSGERNHFYGKKHSPETRRKLSEAAKGRVISEETRRKLSEARTGEKNHLYGKRHSTETRRKISEGKTGKKCSEETKRKMSEVRKGKPIPWLKDRTPWNKGKKGTPHSAETKRKISKSGKHPMYYPAKEFFHTLPTDMPLSEKRKKVIEFSGRPYRTVCGWTLDWQSE